MVMTSKAIPVHFAFRLPKMPQEGLWSVKVFPTRQTPVEHLPRFGPHPRLMLERPCAACNFPHATCIRAGGGNFIGNIIEDFEYACPTCGAFTTYKLFL